MGGYWNDRDVVAHVDALVWRLAAEKLDDEIPVPLFSFFDPLIRGLEMVPFGVVDGAAPLRDGRFVRFADDDAPIGYQAFD